MVRGELAALLRLAIAAAAGGQHDGAGFDLVLAAAGAPPGRRLLELDSSGDLGNVSALDAFDHPPQRLRDRVAGSVADLEQALPRRAAAAREPVAAVLARELDALLLEPVNGRREPRT